MPDDRKLKVFLCHASQDKTIVRELYQRLLAEGWIDPWLDKEKLLPGQDWELEIEKSVEAADLVIICLSKVSVEKEGYFQKELRKALDVADQKPEGTIFIIPLRLDDCQISRRLARLQYVDYFPASNQVAAYDKLRASLKTRKDYLGMRRVIEVDRKLRVFLCGSSKDKLIIQDFYQQLSAERWVDLWLEEERIFKGMNRDMEIERAVKAADAMIICLSHNSVTKDGRAQHELSLVLNVASEKPEGTIFIIPLKLDECQVPKRMRFLQPIDFSLPEDRESAYSSLLRSLEIQADIVNRRPIDIQPAHFTSMFDFVPLASCGFGFVKIPQGEFIIGSKASNNLAGEDEIPRYPCTIPYDYWISRFPISNEQFSEFAVSTECTVTLPNDWKKKLKYPIVNVTWRDAVSYAHWLNKIFEREIPRDLVFRLPTEAEWERASRGDAAGEWPWGNESLDDLLKKESSSQKIQSEIKLLRHTLDIMDVGSFSPLTDSPFDVADMMGSIMEWTQSLYASYPYNAHDGRENLGTEGKRVIRGCFTSNQERFSVRSAKRAYAPPDRKAPVLGFRIVIAPPIS